MRVSVRVRAYLEQGFELCLHDEVILAEFTAARVRGLDPLVETRPVDEAQAARAPARRNQRVLLLSLAVADSAR